MRIMKRDLATDQEKIPIGDIYCTTIVSTIFLVINRFVFDMNIIIEMCVLCIFY